MEDVKGTRVWNYAEEPVRDLIQESYYLLEKAEPGLHDYSYIVFPIAKAFEGFLKKIFLDLKFISKRQYLGDRFRIGRSLNPNLPVRYRWDWVFGKLTAVCGSEELPRKMWQAWKNARNETFHYFPQHSRFVSLNEARMLVEEVLGVMEETLAGCRLTY